MQKVILSFKKIVFGKDVIAGSKFKCLISMVNVGIWRARKIGKREPTPFADFFCEMIKNY